MSPNPILLTHIRVGTTVDLGSNIVLWLAEGLNLGTQSTFEETDEIHFIYKHSKKGTKILFLKIFL